VQQMGACKQQQQQQQQQQPQQHWLHGCAGVGDMVWVWLHICAACFFFVAASAPAWAQPHLGTLWQFSHQPQHSAGTERLYGMHSTLYAGQEPVGRVCLWMYHKPFACCTSPRKHAPGVAAFVDCTVTQLLWMRTQSLQRLETH
jgi:hypothetical protein